MKKVRVQILRRYDAFNTCPWGGADYIGFFTLSLSRHLRSAVRCDSRESPSETGVGAKHSIDVITV